MDENPRNLHLLGEVPGKVHHDGNGGEEADDAGGVVERMVLRPGVG